MVIKFYFAIEIDRTVLVGKDQSTTSLPTCSASLGGVIPEVLWKDNCSYSLF